MGELTVPGSSEPWGLSSSSSSISVGAVNRRKCKIIPKAHLREHKAGRDHDLSKLSSGKALQAISKFSPGM